MPKITKEVNERKKKNLDSKTTSASKKSSTTKAVATRSKSTSKSTPNKVPSSTKKANKKTKTAVSKKATSNKKTPSRKTNSNKKVVKNTKSKKQPINVLEYYDLPYRYNKTIVKVLAQTPKTLFVYWDISDSDRESYIKEYGENFFENTKPVLIIHNTTMNYTFEIEINDFANCWYFNINDEKCEYLVELGRRPKSNNKVIPNDYLYITSSNKIESPNGHILFEKEQKTLYYRNVKTNQTYSKDIANLEFIKYFGRIYNIYDMYKKIYKEEEFLQGPNNPTSSFK